MYTSSRKDICCDWQRSFVGGKSKDLYKLVSGSSRLFILMLHSNLSPTFVSLEFFGRVRAVARPRKQKGFFLLKCLLGGLAQTRNNWDSKAVV